jgi:hypothetical protein
LIDSGDPKRTTLSFDVVDVVDSVDVVVGVDLATMVAVHADVDPQRFLQIK